MEDKTPQNPPLSKPAGPSAPGEPAWRDPFAPPPRYGFDPEGTRPPKKKRKIWWVLLLLVVLVGVGFFGLLYAIGSVLFGGGGGGSPSIGFRHKIGLVRIEGLITQGKQLDFWLETFSQLAESDNIKGIVLRIDSPGGSIGAAQEIYETVADIRTESSKPVYVSMGDVCASGGYYIASAADRIYALKGTLTGSIGVLFEKPQLSELAQKIGVETEVIKSGSFKDSGDIMRPMTDKERDVFNFLIQDAHQQFMEDVLRFRSEQLLVACKHFDPANWENSHLEQPKEQTAEAFLDRLSDGRAFSGRQAVELGMIDEIGTLNDTITALTQRLGIVGRPDVYEPERKTTLRDLLMSRMDRYLPRGQSYKLHYLMDLP